uniref:Uncharacterized protein n=1 Tax=Haptolina brevifila TaxID=156173 RepID=A0A7S2GWS9_9EUKA
METPPPQLQAGLPPMRSWIATRRRRPPPAPTATVVVAAPAAAPAASGVARGTTWRLVLSCELPLQRHMHVQDGQGWLWQQGVALWRSASNATVQAGRPNMLGMQTVNGPTAGSPHEPAGKHLDQHSVWISTHEVQGKQPSTVGIS